MKKEYFNSEAVKWLTVEVMPYVKLSGNEFKLMLALCRRKNHDTGLCCPSEDTLMADTGITQQT